MVYLKLCIWTEMQQVYFAKETGLLTSLGLLVNDLSPSDLRGSACDLTEKKNAKEIPLALHNAQLTHTDLREGNAPKLNVHV